jgi:DNA repair exonuclease SbcCD ATPase subunit
MSFLVNPQYSYIQNKFLEIYDQFRDLKKSLNEITTKFNSLDYQVQNHNQNINSFHQNIDSLNQNISSLDHQIQDHNENINSLKSQVQTHNQNINNNTTNFEHLDTSVTTIKENLDKFVAFPVGAPDYNNHSSAFQYYHYKDNNESELEGIISSARTSSNTNKVNLIKIDKKTDSIQLGYNDDHRSYTTISGNISLNMSTQLDIAQEDQINDTYNSTALKLYNNGIEFQGEDDSQNLFLNYGLKFIVNDDELIIRKPGVRGYMPYHETIQNSDIVINWGKKINT